MFQPEILENIATNLPVMNPLGGATDLESQVAELQRRITMREMVLNPAAAS